MRVFKEPTGEIIVRRLWPGGVASIGEHYDTAHAGDPFALPCDCPTTVEAEWKGGRLAEVSGELLDRARRGQGGPDFKYYGFDRYYIAGFHVLVIGLKPPDGPCYRDVYVVMEDGLRAAATKLYYDAVLGFLDRVVRAEAWLRSDGIPELLEGQAMPAAGWLAKRLL